MTTRFETQHKVVLNFPHLLMPMPFTCETYWGMLVSEATRMSNCPRLHLPSLGFLLLHSPLLRLPSTLSRQYKTRNPAAPFPSNSDGSAYPWLLEPLEALLLLHGPPLAIRLPRINVSHGPQILVRSVYQGAMLGTYV